MLRGPALGRVAAALPKASVSIPTPSLPPVAANGASCWFAFRSQSRDVRPPGAPFSHFPSHAYATEAAKKQPRKAGVSATRKRAASKTAATVTKPRTKTASSKKARSAKSTKAASAKKPKSTKRKAKTRTAVGGSRIKRASTPEDKERMQLKKLTAEALKPPQLLPASAWIVLLAEVAKSSTGVADIGQAAKKASARYASLSPAELEHYNHVANENKTKNEATYKAWIESHTPEQIRVANNARRVLKRKLKSAGKSRHFALLRDERLVTGPATRYSLFYRDRYNSGDFRGMKAKDAGKLAGGEWRALTASEKQKYVDQEKNLRSKYRKDYAETYGHPPNTKPEKAKAAA